MDGLESIASQASTTLTMDAPAGMPAAVSASGYPVPSGPLVVGANDLRRLRCSAAGGARLLRLAGRLKSHDQPHQSP